eukprot:6190231-Pleurochrysis_carterae.AAC.3
MSRKPTPVVGNLLCMGGYHVRSIPSSSQSERERERKNKAREHARSWRDNLRVKIDTTTSCLLSTMVTCVWVLSY